MPLYVSILQARTCQILSLAENPRWSRVWLLTIPNLSMSDVEIERLKKTKFKSIVRNKKESRILREPIIQ